MPNKDFTASVMPAPQPSRYAVVAALTFIAVMLTGLWQISVAAWNPAQLDFPRTWLDFREGRTTGVLEKQLDKKLPARATLIATANSVRYVLTRGGGDQVRVGSDGWLFLTDELKFETDAMIHLAARAQLLGAAARGLDKQGVKLVVALVPDKARLYASGLSGGQYPTYNLSRYQDSLTALGKQDVTAIDLLTPLANASLQGQVYYSSDTHWNQAGAQISANATALAVRKLGIELEKTTFATVAAGAKTERVGDLSRLMGLADVPSILRPPSDIEIPMATRQTSADAAAGLFGDAAVPVTLTGTSYSLRGNFHGFLQQALSAKVLNAAKDGGGLLQATTAYLTDDAFKSAKPKILVWEVPERFLYSPLDDEPKWLKTVGLLP